MLSDTFLQTRPSGKVRRLRRLFDKTSRRALVVPVDDSLISGPIAGLEDLELKLREILKVPPNGLLAFPGTANTLLVRDAPVSLIVNLTTSTTLSTHTRKLLSFDVEHACRLGADAVAVHVNLTSVYEPEMLKSLADVIEESEKFGMPVLGIMYPRSESDGRDNNYESIKATDPTRFTKLVAHACRVGMELGVDLLKTQFTGSVDSFRSAVSAAQGVPVFVAGGALVEERAALERAAAALSAGASGISYGRNIFSRPNATPFISALLDIVHMNGTIDEALERNGLQPMHRSSGARK